jgi:hypothetical protein
MSLPRQVIPFLGFMDSFVQRQHNPAFYIFLSILSVIITHGRFNARSNKEFKNKNRKLLFLFKKRMEYDIRAIGL